MEATMTQTQTTLPFRTLNDVDFHENYNVLKSIGKGVSGAVFLATHKLTKEKFAIKQILKSSLQTAVEYARNEIEILMHLDHPNIVKLYETYEDSESFLLVMEMCEGGQLFDVISGMDYLSERNAAYIFR
jgi:calcium-dependent protein kinase